MAVPACESISNRGSLEPPQPLPPPPRAPGTTPVGAGATTREVEADAKQPAIRRWTSKDKENALKGLLKIPRGREESADAAVAAVVAVESDGRETASAADAAAVAAAAAGVEAGAVDFTAGGGDTPGGGGTSGLMSQVEAVKAAALAVGVEVEAQPSSSPALTKLEGMTKELRLACQGLGGTATAAAAAAGEASALAGVAAAACAAWERLNAEVADQDRTKESLSQRVAAELVERDCGVAAIKKEVRSVLCCLFVESIVESIVTHSRIESRHRPGIDYGIDSGIDSAIDSGIDYEIDFRGVRTRVTETNEA